MCRNFQEYPIYKDDDQEDYFIKPFFHKKRECVNCNMKYESTVYLCLGHYQDIYAESFFYNTIIFCYYYDNATTK